MIHSFMSENTRNKKRKITKHITWNRQEINKIIETHGENYGVTVRSRYKKKARVLKDHHPVFQYVPIMDIERCIQTMGMSHNRENNTFTQSFITETPQRSTQRSPLHSLDANSSILATKRIEIISQPNICKSISTCIECQIANVQSLKIQNNKLQINNKTLTIENRRLITQNTTLQTKLDDMKAMKHKQTIQMRTYKRQRLKSKTDCPNLIVHTSRQ
eukprot:564259_1